MAVEELKKPVSIRRIAQNNRHYDGGILFRKGALPQPLPSPEPEGVEERKVDITTAIALLILGVCIGVLWMMSMPAIKMLFHEVVAWGSGGMVQ